MLTVTSNGCHFQWYRTIGYESERLLFWKSTKYNDSAKCFLFIEIEIQLHVLNYFYHIVLIVIRYICVTC